jgi:hypothetical protein
VTFEKITLPGLSDDEDRTLNGLLEQLDKLARRNRRRTEYYDSKRMVRQVGTTIPPQYMQLALVLGWPAKAVDALARRSTIESFVWPDGDLESLGMRDLSDANFLLSELSQARTDSLIHGLAFLITTQGDSDEPKALVHAKDALNATGAWNNRARRLDNLLSVTSRDDEGHPNGLALYLDGLTISAEKDQGAWKVVNRSEHPWGVPADPLIYKPRSSRRLGQSRITRPVMSLTNQAMRSLVRLEAHMDIYAITKLVMLGADESIFKNADGSPKQSWQVVMGRVFGIPDNEEAQDPQLARADIKQFAAEDPAPHLAHLNFLAKAVAREASLPDSATAITDMANPTSAEAYDASQHELIAEAEGANDDWSVPIRRSVARALAIWNGESSIPADWASIQPQWRNPRFLSRAAQADAGMKQLTAIPWLADTEVGLELLGLDDQQIKRALADRRRTGGSAALRQIAQSALNGPQSTPPVVPGVGAGS